MARKFQNLMVTGGAGFIGVNFIRWLLEQKDCPARIVNVDKLTYAGNPLSLLDVAETAGDRATIRFLDLAETPAATTAEAARLD